MRLSNNGVEIFMDDKHNKSVGRYGEDISANFLSRQGYEIIEKNFSCKVGEIDIIARDKDELVFIEVKTRYDLSHGVPAEAVDLNKKKHIYRAAEYFLMIHNILDTFVRIDVIEVYLGKNGYRLNHIKKAILDKV